ncbi:hypothetical protein R1flu_022414 [Riccia fluitans]|uniref:Uncharacterized protein n=1 Tax=Riccia fluitans TaxID=41844 RepID=A0ABD1ZS46_9MARC
MLPVNIQSSVELANAKQPPRPAEESSPKRQLLCKKDTTADVTPTVVKGSKKMRNAKKEKVADPQGVEKKDVGVSSKKEEK